MTLFRTEPRTALCDGGCGVTVEREVTLKPNGEVLGGIAPWLCPACEAKTRLREAEELERAKQERARLDAEGRAELRRGRAAKVLNVPTLYAGVSFDSWEMHGDEIAQALQDRLREIGRAYLRKWPNVPALLVLRGEPGTGKGHWAWSCAKGLAEGGHMVSVVKCSDMVRRLRAGWKSKDAEAEESVLRDLRTLDLLVVDEVSRHAFYGDSIHQHLYDVLDHRMEWARPTIVTSNETTEGLKEILRPALWDRIHAAGGVLEFGAVSYRRRRP